MAQTKLFLSLEDAVRVALNEGLIDAEDEAWLASEFEQKCYVTDDQYAIGFREGVEACIKILNEFKESD